MGVVDAVDHLFRFYAGPEDAEMSLFANIFGDFGAAGMPGTFKRFFVDVVVNMARSVRVLTSAVSPLSREGSRGGLEKLPTDHE